VEWHDRWSETLDDALKALPESEACPHELFRLLAQQRGPLRKRVALVLEAGEPIAVIALRRRFDLWESVCDGIVPNAFAVMRPARWDAVTALGRLVKVNEWPGIAPSLAADREVKPRYRVATRLDLEALWKRQHNAESIARARNRCGSEGGFTFEVDGERAGSLGYERLNERNRIVRGQGLAIAAPFRGRGIADEAARQLQRVLLRDLGYHRIELQVYGFNERALRHAERAERLLQIGPRLDLDEGQQTAAAHDQVDLAERGAVAARDHAIAAQAEAPGGQHLRPAAPGLMPRAAHGSAPARPATCLRANARR